MESGPSHRQRELIVGCVLLLLAEAPDHGYGLHVRLGELMAPWEMRPASLYRELRRLEGDGLVESTWEASQVRGPARRVYELTPAGRSTLDGWALDVRRLIATLEVCLSVHETLPPPRPARRRRRRHL